MRLPHHWWVLGVDLQLGDDLDEPQVQYFQRVAEALEEDARIILCMPEPQWIYERSVLKDPSPDAAATRFLEQNILKRKISVFIAGDLHCYRRHETADGVQKIVWGGGGAFLRPTHVRSRRRLVDGSQPKTAYPPPATSRRIAWRNLLFPFLNPRFFWLPAVLYTLTAWFASTNLSAETVATAGSALRAAIEEAVRDPVDGLWILLFIGGFVAFTDTHVKWYRIAGGIVHAIAHLLLAFAIGWAALRLTALLRLVVRLTPKSCSSPERITFLMSGLGGSFADRPLSAHLVAGIRAPRPARVFQPAGSGLQGVAAHAHRRGRCAHCLRSRHRSRAAPVEGRERVKAARWPNRTTRPPRRRTSSSESLSQNRDRHATGDARFRPASHWAQCDGERARQT